MDQGATTAIEKAIRDTKRNLPEKNFVLRKVRRTLEYLQDRELAQVGDVSPAASATAAAMGPGFSAKRLLLLREFLLEEVRGWRRRRLPLGQR